MPFFKSDMERILDNLHQAENLLLKISAEDKRELLALIAIRNEEFRTALASTTTSASERTDIMKQFNGFASTYKKCLSSPKSCEDYIEAYHNRKYYPVGIPDAQTQTTLRHNLSLIGTILGAALILASLAALVSNPLIAVILLPLGITLLTPSCFSLFTPDSPDTTAKKQQERDIFMKAAQLIEPTVFLNKEPNSDNSSFYPVANRA